MEGLSRGEKAAAERILASEAVAKQVYANRVHAHAGKTVIHNNKQVSASKVVQGHRPKTIRSSATHHANSTSSHNRVRVEKHVTHNRVQHTESGKSHAKDARAPSAREKAPVRHTSANNKEKASAKHTPVHHKEKVIRQRHVRHSAPKHGERVAPKKHITRHEATHNTHKSASKHEVFRYRKADGT